MLRPDRNENSLAPPLILAERASASLETSVLRCACGISSGRSQAHRTCSVGSSVPGPRQNDQTQCLLWRDLLLVRAESVLAPRTEYAAKKTDHREGGDGNKGACCTTRDEWASRDMWAWCTFCAPRGTAGPRARAGSSPVRTRTRATLPVPGGACEPRWASRHRACACVCPRSRPHPRGLCQQCHAGTGDAKEFSSSTALAPVRTRVPRPSVWAPNAARAGLDRAVMHWRAPRGCLGELPSAPRSAKACAAGRGRRGRKHALAFKCTGCGLLCARVHLRSFCDALKCRLIPSARPQRTSKGAQDASNPSCRFCPHVPDDCERILNIDG